MQSTIIKRSIVINGHKTSVSLENDFWSGLKEIARIEKTTLSSCVAAIDGGRANGNLSSAIRLFVLKRFRAARTSPQDLTPRSLPVPGTAALP